MGVGIFFPHEVGAHYYCVVFNFKKCTMEVIENREGNGEFEEFYDYDIHILATMLVQHLKSANHPAWRWIESAEKVTLEGNWQTRKNESDCGVFVMRGMETYMGGGSRNWYTGLAKEGVVQDRQLEILRKKYTAKILLSENNNRRRFVQDEICRYYAMDKGSRDQIMEMANNTRKLRLSLHKVRNK